MASPIPQAPIPYSPRSLASTLGPTDQRSQIRTFNVAPTWIRLLGSNAVVTIGAFVRRVTTITITRAPILSPTLGRTSQRRKLVSQDRFLTNAGVHVRRVLREKASTTLRWDGHVYQHTFLTENDGFGIVNPGACILARPGLGCPDSTNSDPGCNTAGTRFDLTARRDPFQLSRPHGCQGDRPLRAGHHYHRAMVLQPGIRGDILSLAYPARQPGGAPCWASPTTSSQQIRFFGFRMLGLLETPFNENLILSGNGCRNPVVNAIMTVAQGFACATGPTDPRPAQRISRRPATGLRQALRLRRRLHVEVHTQWIRLQRAVQHSHHLPD